MNILRSLTHRPFALLWAGQTTSRLGDSLYRIALSWWVLEKTGSAVAMGTVLVFSQIPMLIFLLIGGVVVDRLPRIRVMFVADVISGLVIGFVAVFSWLDLLQIWHIYIASMIFGFVEASRYMYSLTSSATQHMTCNNIAGPRLGKPIAITVRRKFNMNKILLHSASLILAIALAFGNFIPGRATSQIPVLMPDQTINLAFFYKPPTNSDAVTVAGFGSVILTGGDESFRDQLVANGFNSNITQYYRAEAIQDPGNCTSSPWKNQIAFKAGDFCNISTNHPDWFLLDTNGNRIRIGSGNYYRMDPGNAGWRNFFVTRLIEIQQLKGWSGVFLDNLEAGVNQIQLDGVTAAKYPDNASYRPAVRGFVQYLYQNYAVPYNRPLMANIIARSTTDEAIWLDYMQYLNGAMQERWAVDWDYTDYLSETNWKADMALAEKTQAQGKYIILVAPGEKTDTNRQKFAFASYLLISNGKAAFRYSNSSIYREVWSYDNYKVQLGSPRGPRYQTGTSWRRDFTNGYVIVDPVNHTATISTTPGSTVTSTPTRLNTSTATSVPTLAGTSTETSTPMVTATQVTTSTATLIPTLAATQTTVSTPTSIPSSTATPVTKTPTTAPASGSTMYDHKNSAFSYSAGWAEVPEASAYEGSYTMTKKAGASVTFTFTGQSFNIIYRSGPGYGKMQVYLDGKRIATLNQSTESYIAQKKWKYTGTLATGKHTIKLVSSSRDGVKTTLDAISIR